MNTSYFLSTSTPTKVLFAFTFVHQFIAVMHAGLDIDPSQPYQILSWLAGYFGYFVGGCWMTASEQERLGRWTSDIFYLLRGF